MLTLQCEIKIHNIDSGKTISFNYANSIVVKTSCRNLTDTATVKVPRKMSWRGKKLTDFVRRNDEIDISIGYEEYGLETVFKGYVSRVENGTPIVIECENEMRLFKTITVKAEIIPNFKFDYPTKKRHSSNNGIDKLTIKYQDIKTVTGKAHDYPYARNMAIYYLQKLMQQATYLGNTNDIKGDSVKGHSSDIIWHYYSIPFMKKKSYLIIKEVGGNKYVHHMQDENHFKEELIKNKVKQPSGKANRL